MPFPPRKGPSPPVTDSRGSQPMNAYAAEPSNPVISARKNRGGSISRTRIAKNRFQPPSRKSGR